MKKVVFYSPLTYTPHWEIELNLMENYLRAGDWQIVLLVCNADLPACLANPYHTFTRCLECKTRKKAGIKWIGKDRITVKPFYKISKENQLKINQLKDIKIESLDQLNNIYIEDSDIGVAALSTAITTLRDSEIDVVKHQKLLKNYLLSAAIAHFSITDRLLEEKPDELVAFNGRIASVRPALRAAWKLGIKTLVHESGKVSNRFWMVENSFIHSLSGKKRLIEEAFANSELEFAEIKKIAVEWFEERRNKTTLNQKLFIENQQIGRLPEHFSKDKINVVIYNSSEDEFVGFDEYKNPFYKNQNDCIRRLLEDLRSRKEIEIYVRIHPNLNKLQNTQIRELYKIAEKFSELNLIEPNSPVDSYELLELSDLIIVFNSTIGIEAVYRGKTPIIMGRSVYEDMGGIIKPGSHKELIEIINNYQKDKTLPALENAEKAWVKFGYFMQRGGRKLDFVKKDDWWKAKMIRDGKETYINPSNISKIFNKLFRKPD